MTKNKRRILKIGLIVFIIAFFYIISHPDFYYNWLPHQSLPNKYQSYKELKNIKKQNLFEIYELSHLLTYYDSIQNILICEEENEDKSASTFYKMNANGFVTDSLKVNESIDYEYHYLLRRDSYYDWIITGNAQKQKYLFKLHKNNFFICNNTEII